MAEIMVDPVGWVYFVLVLDWDTKKIVWHYTVLQSKTMPPATCLVAT